MMIEESNEVVKFKQLLQNIKCCSVCSDLPFGINPVVQLSHKPRIVIIGQAPGKRVHETNIPWNDRSGDTLRNWLGVTKEEFYNPELFAIMGMGFCYPGKGPSGDLPPRKECAKLWHPQIVENTTAAPNLTLLIGQYAQQYYLKNRYKKNLTNNIANFREYLPQYFVLPHPSPRNQLWLKKNQWFNLEVLPALQGILGEILHRNQHYIG